MGLKAHIQGIQEVRWRHANFRFLNMLRNHLVWDEQRHGTGVAAIDGEHRRMVELINHVNDMLCDGGQAENAWDAVDQLLLFTEEHFANEERLMARHGYPAMPDHVEEHHKLLEQLRTLTADCRRARTPAKAGLVAAFLADWAELHILHDDRGLGEYLSACGTDA